MSIGDSMDWTPCEALSKLAVEANNLDASAAIGIILDKELDNYNTKYHISGLSCSEAIALLEVIKSKLIAEINKPI